jgi:hypothetical protein
MLGMGISAKNIIPDLTALGDAVASVGGSATQVDQVTAAVSDVRQGHRRPRQRCIRSSTVASRTLSTTWPPVFMSRPGSCQHDQRRGCRLVEALPALVRGLENGTKSIRGFGGMMDKQSHTFAGALSNIRDGLTQTTAKAFKPFFDVASVGMGRFAKALSGKPAEKFQKDVTKTLRPFATEIGTSGSRASTSRSSRGHPRPQGDAKGINPKDLRQGFKDIGKDATDLGKSTSRRSPQVIKASRTSARRSGTIKMGRRVTGAFARGATSGIDMVRQGPPRWSRRSSDGWDQIVVQAGQSRTSTTASSSSKRLLQRSFGSDRSSQTSWQVDHGWDQIAGSAHSSPTVHRGGQEDRRLLGAIPGQLATIGGQIVSGFVGGITRRLGGCHLHHLEPCQRDPGGRPEARSASTHRRRCST